MKKFLFVSYFALFALVSKAQSGLQFNQALFLPLSFTSSGGTVSLGTVPSGKVWKLEQVLCAGTNLENYYFQFNGGAALFPVPVQGGSYDYMNNNTVWWPAGTVISVFIGNTGVTSMLYFSILEFNVVQ